jgi:hypothetical protein
MYGLLVIGEVCYADDERIRHNNEVLGGNYTQLGDSASWYEGNAARLCRPYSFIVTVENK